MTDSLTRTLTIQNKKGLHARASSRFVQTVEAFSSDIMVSKGDTEVSGNSILDLMMLAASTGSHLEISATGADAHDALDAIEALITDKFGETE